MTRPPRAPDPYELPDDSHLTPPWWRSAPRQSPTCGPEPRLLDRLRDTLRVRGYSPRTEEAYIPWVRRFIAFHKMRDPKEMGADEVRAFLTHLACDRRVTSSTQNQALCAIAFLWYGPGEDGGLTQFLAREPAQQYGPVRAAVRDGHRIMFYTTAWQQTWLFFDDSERLVGYWFSTQ